jgi:hypothetical protein
MKELDRSAGGDMPPSVAMLRMIACFWISRAIYIAARLGVADLLKDGPRHSEELAQAAGMHARSFYRVLRALASVGVFAEDEQGRFALTPLAATLRTDVPGSLRAFAISLLDEDHYAAWGEVMHSLKTGEVAFDHCFGMDVWQYRAGHPEAGGIFDEAMRSFSSVVNAAVVESYDFSSIGRIVDIGGGDGSLITSILQANPSVQGVLFELPHVIAGARWCIERAELTERCAVVAGDFFSSVPAGGDAYILKWVIHDWDDERGAALLRNCRQAMAEDGRLLLVEAVIPMDNSPSFHKFMDLNMLVMTGGRERTEVEYRTLLEAAGFRLTRIVPTPSEMMVIEAAPT